MMRFPGFKIVKKAGLEDYYKQFKKLDTTDLEIIKAMAKYGPRNLSQVSRKIGIPQQTINYRVLRFERDGLVRFKALLNDATLNLDTYFVFAVPFLGRMDLAEMALTPIPLWRYTSICMSKEGSYIIVRYSVPRDKHDILEAYLQFLRKENVIKQYNISKVQRFEFPLINLDVYIKKTTFKWKTLINRILEPGTGDINSYSVNRLDFSEKDLFILSQLELDARTKFTVLSERLSNLLNVRRNFKPWISKRYKEYLEKGVIKNFRPTIVPFPPYKYIMLILTLQFNHEYDLERFIKALNYVPYHVSCYILEEAPTCIMIILMPSDQIPSLHDFLLELAKKNVLSGFSFYLGNPEKSNNNVGLYQAFKNGEWLFSYDLFVENYRRIRSEL